jgi:hypothetical protein
MTMAEDSTDEVEELEGASLRNLARLESLWRERTPKQARGGGDALAGFRYQFEVTALEAVREWLRRPGPDKGDPAVFAEILSDFVLMDRDQGCTITQVKLTLRKAEFEKALDDFVRLKKMVDKAGIDVGEIRFRIVGSRGNLDRAWYWLTNWARAADPEARSACQRVELVLESRPREKALALLANELHATAPGATFDAVLKPLFEAARGGKFREAAVAMWEVLQEAERPEPVPGSMYVWTAADRPPRTLVPGDVVTGAQPLVNQLRRGYFEPRVAIDERVAPQVCEWLDEKAEDPPPKLQILWLAAPPGAGKSVALLQVLARVHAGNRHRVFYAGTVHGGLARSVDWALGQADEGSPTVIGIDDPYPAANGRRLDSTWDEVVARLEPLRHAGDYGMLPLIVAAGTEEQERRLAEDFADHLDIHEVQLAPETTASVASLARWFEQRTGKPVEGSADPSEPLVHLVFEWAAGSDLREFAIRLRRRLDELDERGEALAMAERILLLDIFGLGLPAGSLTGRLGPTAAEHMRPFLLGCPELTGDVSVRIAHRRVATEIAEYWFADRSSADVAERFVGAITDLARDAGTADERAGPARLLAMLAWGGPDPLLGNVLEVAARVYPEVVGLNGGTVPSEQLLPWLSLRAAGAHLASPDPIDLAVERITPQGVVRPGAASLLGALLRTEEQMTLAQRGDIRGLVMGLLKRYPRWIDWWTVAIGLAEHLPDPELGEVVAARAKVQRSAVVGRALLAVERALPNGREVGDAAAAIAKDREHPAWSYAWSILWRRHGPNDSLAGRALLWMGDVGTHRSLPRVWGALWREREQLPPELREACAERGLEFLGRELSTVGWAWVWTTLWDDEPIWRPQLRPLGDAWLARTIGIEPAAAHVWERLWKEAGDDDVRLEALRIEGVRWLAAAPGAKGWGLVFATLSRDGQVDGLEERGHSWLQIASPSHHDWVRVWQALRATPWGSEHRDLLVEDARRWLGLAPAWHQGRSSLVGDLRRDEVGPWLREDTIAWLAAHHDFPRTWGWVWVSMDDGSDPALRSMAMTFCRERMRDPSWARLWSTLLKEGCEAELFNFGRRWLEVNPVTDRSRGFVVLTLLKVDTEGMPPGLVAERRIVRDEALIWMSRVKQWGEEGDLVWQHLFDTEPALRTRLSSSGYRWLRWSDFGARGWMQVWKRIVSLSPDDPRSVDLLGRQFARFERRPFMMRSPVYSLLGLAKADPDARPLLEIAIGSQPSGPEPPAAVFLRALLTQLDPGAGDDREGHARLLVETVAALVAAVEPNDLDQLYAPLVAWVAAQPGIPGVVLVDAMKSLRRANLPDVADRYLAAARLRLEGHPEEDDLRWFEMKGMVSLRDPDKVETILRGAVARIRESDHLNIELVTITLWRSARAGSLDNVRDLLRWAVGYLQRDRPQRSDETVVAACNGVYLRLREEGSDQDADVLHAFGRVYNEWRAAFPRAPVRPLGHQSRRLSIGTPIRGLGRDPAPPDAEPEQTETIARGDWSGGPAS